MKIEFLTAPLLLIALAETTLAGPISTNPANYAIVGESGVTLSSQSVDMTVLGDVYSAGNLTLQEWYGIGSSANAGNMISGGSINVGSYASVTGNLTANGAVTVGYGAHLNGNVVYGSAYSNPSPVYPVTGTVTQAANSVPAVSLPTATSVTSGTNNVSTSSNLTLAPGTYGNVTESGLYQNLTLSSGDYYLTSLNMPSAGYLYLNITNAPIRVFVQGNINFGSYLTTYLNGQSSGTSSLASSVLFQCGGNFNLAGGNIYNFYGTVFTPSGSTSLNDSQMNGSILSSGSINVSTYLTGAPYNWSNLPVLSMSTTGATVITGGTANLGISLANIEISGGSAANYALAETVSSGSFGGSQSFSQSGTVSAQASQTTSVPATSTNLGVNTLVVAATAANSFGPIPSATVSLTVLDHAAPILSTSAASAGRVMRNAANASGSATLANASAAYRSGLQITSLSPGLSGLSVGNLISNGGSMTVSGSLNTSLTGPATTAYTIGVSDNQTLSGAIALPSLSFAVTGTVLDNRLVTAPPVTDLGYIHTGGVASAALLLSTIGDDSHYTRITVADSAAADANGLSVSGGSTALRFGYDAMSDLRTLGGTLASSLPLGSFSGSLSLTAGTEAGVVGAQSPTNVVVNYVGQVYSGKAAWSGSAGGSWGTMTHWQDTQPGGPNGGAPGTSGFAGDTASFGDSIGSAAATVMLNGQNPVLASLSFGTHLGGSYNIASGSGGQITVSAGTAASVITVNGGNHQISAPLALTNTANITVTNPQDSLTISGNISGQSPINMLGAGLLTITGTASPSAVTISGGTLQGNTSNVTGVTNNGALILNQPSDGVYSATMTGSGSFTKSGSARLTLAGADNLSTTGPITVQQGTLIAPLGIPHNGGGIQVSAGGTLQAAQSIIRSVAGNGTVTAAGDLFIGQSSQAGQFNLGGAPGVGGTLNVGGNAVVILSADAAILGSLTNIGAGGSLTALSGVQLGNASSVDSTKVLTATGNAAINANFVNNGVVNGPTGTGQELLFNQAVTGAGSTTGNVEYAASYRPSNSPDAVSVQNVLLAPTSTLIMEVAGVLPGSGYDQLDISGLATLNGTLELSYLDGFSPSAGESFQIFDGPTTGSFSEISLPALGSGLSWDTSNLYTNGSISVVPEPSTLWLLGVGAMGLLGYAWRRKRSVDFQ